MARRVSTARPALVVLALATAIGCGSSGRDLTPPPSAEDATAVCRTDGDCGAGSRCVARRCRAACAADADCADGICDLVSGSCASSRCLDGLDCQLDERCEEGWCLPRPATPVCQPLSARCEGDDVLVCASDGHRELLVTCDDPCREGLGGAHCGDAECRAWSVGCLDDLTAFACSEDGSAVEEIACPPEQFCYRGHCLSQVCEPDARWCAGDSLVACAADGRRYDSLSCSGSTACADPGLPCVCRDAACASLACEPGSARCLGEGAQRCADDGLYYLDLVPCESGEACWEGSCRPVVCEPGWRQCEGDTLRTCHETGTHVRQRYCPSEERYCSGEGAAAACVERACRPGGTTCTEDGSAMVVCDARGADSETLLCPQWGCSAGACSPEPAPEGWVRVVAGSFTMGSPIDEPGRLPFEEAHEVTVSRPFFLQANEVTQSQWTAAMASQPSFFTDCGEDCPVENVSFWDVLAYANALSELHGRPPCYELSGCVGRPGGGCAGEFLCESDYTCEAVQFVGLQCQGYRLPTEAEWEYAARAGATTAFYAGPITVLGAEFVDPVLEPIAWYAANSGGQVHPVAQKEPNDWGLYDLSGNVYELVWDWFSVDYGGFEVMDPIGPPWGENRVVRGGSWFTESERLRASYRHNLPPRLRINSAGFRLARTARSTPGP